MHPDERSYTLLVAEVEEVLRRIPLPRFSTKRVVDELLAKPEGVVAYQAALAEYLAAGSNDHSAHLIVHGQVIPEIMRHSGLVRFAGFIHGNPAEADGYAVPAWWRRIEQPA